MSCWRYSLSPTPSLWVTNKISINFLAIRLMIIGRAYTTLIAVKFGNWNFVSDLNDGERGWTNHGKASLDPDSFGSFLTHARDGEGQVGPTACLLLKMSVSLR